MRDMADKMEDRVFFDIGTNLVPGNEAGRDERRVMS